MINKKFLVKIKLNINLLNEEYKNSLQEMTTQPKKRKIKCLTNQP